MKKHKYSLQELDDMYGYEYFTYYLMLIEELREKQKEEERLQRANHWG